MQSFDRTGSLGALLLGSALLVYTVYEMVLWPSAGFPSNDVDVILAGAPTLRIGHFLKFADALALALLAVGAHARLRSVTPVTGQLAGIAAAMSATLFLASGMLGLGILDVAGDVYAARPEEAITTIYLRTVTYTLFDAAATAAGAFGLFFSLGALLSGRLPRALSLTGVAFGLLFAINPLLSDNLTIITVVLAMLWCFWLSIVLWRDASETLQLSPAHP